MTVCVTLYLTPNHDRFASQLFVTTYTSKMNDNVRINGISDQRATRGVAASLALAYQRAGLIHSLSDLERQLADHNKLRLQRWSRY